MIEGEPDVSMDVREHLSQPGRLPVVGMAVQQDDRHPGGLDGGQEVGEQSGVAAMQAHVPVTEAGVDLQGQAEVEPRPQAVPDNTRVAQSPPALLLALDEPGCGSPAYLAVVRAVSRQVQPAPVGSD